MSTVLEGFPKEIAERLVARGIPTSTVFVSSSAQIPDTGSVVHLRETGGAKAIRTHNETSGSPSQVRPAMQIVFHAVTNKEARRLAYVAYNALDLHNTTLSGTFYLLLRPQQEPFDFGQDEKGRAQFAFNILALKRPS